MVGRAAVPSPKRTLAAAVNRVRRRALALRSPPFDSLTLTTALRRPAGSLNWPLPSVRLPDFSASVPAQL